MAAATKRKPNKSVDDQFSNQWKIYQERTEWKGQPLINRVWAPEVATVFKLLLSFRFTAALWSNISDCDEAYNYWEPTHYLLYGQGFQTWEYSPVYAIRSYSYIYIHSLPIRLLSLLTPVNKVAAFYIIRCFLALLSASTETYFYRGILKQFGSSVARVTLAFQLISAGMFISSTAYLPSSFSMYMTCLSLGAWFSGHFPIAILSTAVSTFLGWPFAALIGVPIAVDVLFRKRLWKVFLVWSVLSCAFVLGPMVLYDSRMFGKLVVAPVNIVLYNVFTDHGPNLYGTEPWTFYFTNGFLNFNFVFILALTSFVVVYLSQAVTRITFPGLPHWLYMTSMYLWMLVFFTQPHKEERFLFPVYPLICLQAAVSLDSLQRLMVHVSGSKRHYTQVFSSFTAAFVVLVGVISLSRVLALYQGYHAPIDLYTLLRNVSDDRQIHTLPSNKAVNVCVGKEWYRFPSHFFMPSDRWKLKFVRSEFRGQLPAEYLAGPSGTKVIPAHMNDMNKEEESRYIDENRCHYMVDLDVGRPAPREPNYSQMTDKWEIVKSVPFLDSPKSHAVFRAFYIPAVSERYSKYGSYNLLKTRYRQSHTKT